MGKSGMLENKSGNISETRKDRGNVTTDGLQKLTNALSNGTIPDPLQPPLPRDWGLATQLHPLISRTGKATNFKFGEYIYRANANKSPLKILEKRERGRIQGLPKFFGYPLLSRERIRLRTSNFVGIFIGSIRTKAHKNCGNSSRGRSQGVPKIFRAPTYRAHCAVIFAMAQLSHEVPH